MNTTIPSFMKASSSPPAQREPGPRQGQSGERDAFAPVMERQNEKFRESSSSATRGATQSTRGATSTADRSDAPRTQSAGDAKRADQARGEAGEASAPGRGDAAVPTSRRGRLDESGEPGESRTKEADPDPDPELGLRLPGDSDSSSDESTPRRAKGAATGVVDGAAQTAGQEALLVDKDPGQRGTSGEIASAVRRALEDGTVTRGTDGRAPASDVGSVGKTVARERAAESATASARADEVAREAGGHPTPLRDWPILASEQDGGRLSLAREANIASAQGLRLMHQPGAETLRLDGNGLGFGMASHGGAQTAATEAASGPSIDLVKSAGSSGWSDELGNRVVWLVGRRENLAELRLNPPELGSLEVRIRQDSDTTNVSFVVQNASAREALEGALPRLRELFAEAGLALQDVDVAERQAGEHQETAGEAGHRDGETASEEDIVASESARGPLPHGESLIDAYA